MQDTKEVKQLEHLVRRPVRRLKRRRVKRRLIPRVKRLAWAAVLVAVAGLIVKAVLRSRARADAGAVPMDANDETHRRTPARSADATGVAGVLERAAAAGYVAVFEAEPDAAVRCCACDAVSPASGVERHWQNRLEGASDPDDMAQVSGLQCPTCGALGTFVSLFGPGAGTEAAEVMVALPRPRGDLPSVPR